MKRFDPRRRQSVETDYEPRSLTWDEEQIRCLLRETIRETRAHPMRPDGTYNYDMNAIIQKVFDEYYEPHEGWRSHLFDNVIGDGTTRDIPGADSTD